MDIKQNIDNIYIKFKYDFIRNYVTVIIPVYKDHLGLLDTLKTLNSQSIEQERYEIIVSNDGGDERVTEVCKKFGVTMIKIIPNSGSYFARNRALEIARGEYIAFVDADIKVPVYWLEKGIEGLKNADYVCGPIVIDKEKIRNIVHLYQQATAFPVKKYFEISHFGPTANLFVRRNVFEKLGGFDQRLLSGGDFEFGVRVFRIGRFQQSFSEELVVIHPPRDYGELLSKTERVVKGTINLKMLYPEIFKDNNYKSFNKFSDIFKLYKNLQKKYKFVEIMLFYIFMKYKIYIIKKKTKNLNNECYLKTNINVEIFDF